MSDHIDIYEQDPGTGYSRARHILDEIATHGAVDAAELTGWVCDDETGDRMEVWLGDLEKRGWVRSEPASPGSSELVWSITRGGAEHLGVQWPPEGAAEPEQGGDG